MFHSSTQRRDWLFADATTLTEQRRTCNQEYCNSHADIAQEKGVHFLSQDEEIVIVEYYLKKLIGFCSLFKPPDWTPLPRTALVCQYLILSMYLSIIPSLLSLSLYYPSSVPLLICLCLPFLLQSIGHSSHLLQEILFKVFCYGVSPKRYVVSI